MDGKKQILVNSVINFLHGELKASTLNDEKKESLEVAIQCLETAFEIDANSVEKDNVDLLSLLNTESRAEITEEDKLKAEEHKTKGNNAMKDLDYQAALNEYTRAIELNPYNAVYYCNRAAAYTRLEKDWLAIKDSNEAIKIDPTYGKAYGRLGIAYSNLNKYDLAQTAYQTALKYDPNNVMYETNLKLAQERLMANQGTRYKPNSQLSVITRQILFVDNAAPAQHRPIDISQFINNPNIINMATQMLNDPNFGNIMSGLISADHSGEVNVEALFEAGQTLASRMQLNDSNFVETLRRNIDAQSVPNSNQNPANDSKDNSARDKNTGS
ncbi:small glutamine-rich tetratricopeptide repeat-containing protein alpha isoform X1 [Cylas formicarius]|uniref:small glutamine-rich tetratricopeptide repeat-containing protein alpha isoform X1 n=1 Tax=Cylas formicarius TaxID=197179 RepID=UPI00295868C9|nr:small glutamine-rich tetratricopeptide repeat-containing protein alpha isoform X1 [Cylas formicarius]